MAATKAKLPSGAEIRAQIEAAEHAFLSATVMLGEALVVQVAVPERDVSAEQAAVDQARQRADQLRTVLPLIEKAEAEALEETRAKLADEQRRRLEKALGDLIKPAMQFSAHQQNAISAWRRLVSAGETVEGLLFPNQRQIGNGSFQLKLSGAGLHALASQEINRLGLIAEIQAGVPVISAPGTSPEKVGIAFRNAPARLPRLEDQMKRLAAAIIASAPPPLARAVASENAAALPQAAAGSEIAPAGSTEAQAPDTKEDVA